MLKCDVTQDIKLKLDKEVYKRLKTSVCNISKWEISNYKFGVRIKKNVQQENVLKY